MSGQVRGLTSAQIFTLDQLDRQGPNGSLQIGGGYYGVNKRTAEVLVRYGLCRYATPDTLTRAHVTDPLPPQTPGSVGHLRNILSQYPDDARVAIGDDASMMSVISQWRGSMLNTPQEALVSGLAIISHDCGDRW